MDLPADEKIIMIPDLLSCTRIVDAQVECGVLKNFEDWLCGVRNDRKEEGHRRCELWIRGLYKQVQEDMNTIKPEWKDVLDDQRRKGGPSGWKTH